MSQGPTEKKHRPTERIKNPHLLHQIVANIFTKNFDLTKHSTTLSTKRVGR